MEQELINQLLALPGETVHLEKGEFLFQCHLSTLIVKVAFTISHAQKAHILYTLRILSLL